MKRTILAIAIALTTAAIPAGAHADDDDEPWGTCVYWQTEPPPYPIPQGACLPLDFHCMAPVDRLVCNHIPWWAIPHRIPPKV